MIRQVPATATSSVFISVINQLDAQTFVSQ